MSNINFYTSYFAKLKYLPKSVIPVAICSKPPGFYTGLSYKKLAPKYEFFMKWKEDHDNDAFTKKYYDQVLDQLLPWEIADEIYTLARDNSMADIDITGICLVCFEKSTDFCHRHLVAEWLSNNGVSCEEYKF